MDQHLPILPILIPLLAGAGPALVDDRHHRTKLAIGSVATILLLVIALALLIGSQGPSRTVTYQIGDWPAPYGIVLVVDRLSALMVALTSSIAVCALVFSAARWHRAGQHFHSLYQLFRLGINGAFLTGDLFNLFVFFEILLAASYGLALHGSGTSRVKASLHYVAMNLATSSLFLIGATAIYGVVGTLNMADLAVRIPMLAPSEHGLLQTGAAILGIAFLVKAGMWPLGLWLPNTYGSAAPPVAAMFAVLSKVGVYVIIRLTSLLFGDGAGPSAHFGDVWLQYGGLATIVFGAIGVLASQGVGRIACFSVLVSSGTLLAVIGYEDASVTAGALYYLVGSTLALSCLFLLVELMERGRSPGDDVLAVTLEAYGDDDEPVHEQEVGAATPGTLTALGLAFTCCAILVAGIPPLSGFLGKFAMLDAVFGLDDGTGIRPGIWVLALVLIVSGLAATIALMRSGINTFWVSFEGIVPAIRAVEIIPILTLLALAVFISLYAEPVMAFMQQAATSLYDPSEYVGTVLPELNGETAR
jgi:multicomponent K+:H+ antiporter subunit D